jgi:hypothetical protein
MLKAQQRKEDHMTIFTSPLVAIPIILFLLLLLVLLFLIAGDMIRSRHGANINHTQTITATITDIHVEADNLSCAWVVTAQYISLSSFQPLVFVSPHLAKRPRDRIGDTVLIFINPNNPSDYRVQLND